MLQEGQLKDHACPQPQNIPYFTITQETLSKILFDHHQLNNTNTSTSTIDSLQQSPPPHHAIINHIVASLKTDIQTGIHGDENDLYLRHQAFGSNHNYEDIINPRVEPKRLKRLVLDAFKDTNIILLLCCAMLSLLIGIKRNGPREGFLDGAIIFLAIFIVVNFGAIVKFYKARMVKKISSLKVVNAVGVIRRGRVQHIPVSEVVVGDIVILKTGDRIPGDGLYVDGNSFKLDDRSDVHEGLEFSKYPSVFSGGKVVEGEGRMLVTSVGKNTERSKLMRSISNHQSDDDQSKLQIAIDKMNDRVGKVWLCMSLVFLVVQVLKCFVFNSECDENHDPDPKGVKNAVEEIMNEATKVMKKKGVGANGLVGMLCILIFSIRDGLPLGIFIFLAYASNKMKSYKATVLNLPACATTGLVTTICTSKTGDLTLQPMKMAELWIGLDSINGFCNNEVAREVLDRLREAVCISVCGPPDDVLLWWAKKVGLGTNMEELEKSCTFLHNEGFEHINKNWKLLKRNGEVGNTVHVHWKGEPEMVLSTCSHYYHVDGTTQVLDEHKRTALQQIIQTISSHSFAFAYKQVVIEEDEEEEEGKETLNPIEDGLTWLGLVGFKNPYEPRVREAIEACAKLGRRIKLVVGDDIIAAKLMAIYSGILKPEEDIKGAIIEALEFRNSTPEGRLSMMDNMQVMANATPSDRLLMVQCLRQKGEVVAVTGTCIRDSPSLKEADVGIFSCDINGAKGTKENGDIVVLDLNFTTMRDILKLGRCVCNNLEKFLQLQLTLNIVAFILNFTVAVSTSEVPLSPFQLLWVNLIMDVLGALALAVSVAEPPPSQPVYGEGPIITRTMWRNIVVHSVYQITVLLIIQLKGEHIFQVDEAVLKAMVFNCYVLCHVFVLINARESEKANVFEGILKHNNYWFLIIVGAIAVLQEVVIEIAAAVAHSGRLDFKQWCICIGIAGASLLIDGVAKFVFFLGTKLSWLSTFFNCISKWACIYIV